MKRLVLALQLLTSLPLPSVAVDDADFTASIRWFPAAGVVVGGAVLAGAWAGSLIDPWLGALLALTMWVASTGALHLDGLGDIADAVGAAHKDREKLGAVLADPHIGSFGAVAIVLQIAAKLVLLKLVIDAGTLWPLLALPVLARLGTLVWTLALPSLHDGLGSRFRPGVSWRHVALWALFTMVPVAFAPALTVGFALIALWSWWLRRRIGGISGDGHGAGIEWVESGLLLALVVAS